MRAAIFRGGDIVVDTIPEPKPAHGQVLVKTLACGICGSDLHAAKHAHRMVDISRRAGRLPMDLSRDVVMGHEFCCEVIDYGPGTEKKVKPGTRFCAMPVMLEADGPKERLNKRRLTGTKPSVATGRCFARGFRSAWRPIWRLPGSMGRLRSHYAPWRSRWRRAMNRLASAQVTNRR